MAEATADFELGTEDAAVLTSDPGSATAWNSLSRGAGNTGIYDSEHAYGVMAHKVDSTGTPAGNNESRWSSVAIGTLTDHYGRFYLYATANPTSQYRIVGFYNVSTFACRIQINATGTLSGSDNSGLTTTTATISLNQWVRVEWHIIHSATTGQMEVKLFNDPDSITPTETKTSAATRNTLAQADGCRVGLEAGGSSAGPIWLDNIVVGATSYPGPWTPPIVADENLAPVIYGRGAA